MKKLTISLVMAMLLFGMFGTAGANGIPVLNLATGNYYDVVNGSGNWGDYDGAAMASSYLGITGRLATVTSADENAWLVSIFTGAGLNNRMFGGTDVVVEGDWQWITGETWDYTNWAPIEPNNSGNEDYVQFWANNGTWNDISFANTSYNDGYVVEYESAGTVSVPEPATLLLFGGGLLGFAAARSRRKNRDC